MALTHCLQDAHCHFFAGRSFRDSFGSCKAGPSLFLAFFLGVPVFREDFERGTGLETEFAFVDDVVERVNRFTPYPYLVVQMGACCASGCSHDCYHLAA